VHCCLRPFRSAYADSFSRATEAKQDQYLVLSERDNVLKEINQLQDECNESRRKIENFEKDKKSSLEEMEKIIVFLFSYYLPLIIEPLPPTL
jgi:predicted nuclease with TOPRIM domain